MNFIRENRAARAVLTSSFFAVAIAACSSGNLGPGADGGGPVGRVDPNDGGSQPPIDGSKGDGDVPCSGLECLRADCGAGEKTTLTGRVYDPAGANPLYGVLVYIPSGPLAPLGSGATCNACGTTPASLATARTDAHGDFVLDDVPVTSDLPIVIQTGKWRRAIKVDATRKCAENKVPDKVARLPKNGGEGDMPHFAVTTGGCDALECLLRGIGIDVSEFVPGANTTGHVHAFNGEGGVFPGAPAAGGTVANPTGGELWNSSAKMMNYDTVLLSCECSESNENKGGGVGAPGARQALWDYANAGGRVIATHYHYTWFKNSPQNDWNQIAAWNASGGSSGLHDINTSFPAGTAFADWLVATNASTTPGKITLTDVTNSVTSVNAPAQSWITAGSVPRFFTFPTPIAGTACGQVAFTDVHMMGISSGGQAFPNGCPSPGGLSAQQKALEFLLFEMSACKD